MGAGTSYDKPFIEWLLEDALPSEQRFDMNQTYARNAAALIVVGNFCNKSLHLRLHQTYMCICDN